MNNFNKKIRKRYSIIRSSLCFLFFVIFIFKIVNCGIYLSQEELDSLIQIQLRVRDTLKEYVKNEEFKIQELILGQKRFENIENSYKEKLLHNPVNAFVVLKTLAKDLNTFLKSAEETKKNYKELILSVNDIRNVEGFPDEEDVKGAALAINRLQDTYKFNVSQMVDGFLGSHCCSFKLQASDFFELGKQSFISQDYPHTVDWMNQVLNLLNKDKPNTANNEMKAETIKILNNVQRIQKKNEFNENSNLTPIHEQFDNSAYFDMKLDEVPQSKYKSLCRGEIKNLANPQLKCSYSSRNSTYLLIGPIKEEIINISPKIYLFHDVIFDGEIEIIKELSRPNLETGTVISYLTGDLEESKDRTSKVSWFDEADHPLIKKITERIQIVSQLDLKSAEDFQVANYGIGGHYEPHYDFTHGDILIDPEQGNRIATFMFYMSEVEAGGGTVFPQLNLVVEPIKGAAILWYNLLESGDVDFRTEHAACPVLLGSKWVSNKWIHERGQEFKRPCIKE